MTCLLAETPNSVEEAYLATAVPNRLGFSAACGPKRMEVGWLAQDRDRGRGPVDAQSKLLCTGTGDGR